MSVLFELFPHNVHELHRDLEPYLDLFTRDESKRALERYIVGLLSKAPKKNCQGIADTIIGTSAQRLQELLTNTNWDEQTFNTRRIRHLSKDFACPDGSIVIGDATIPKQGRSSAGVGMQYSTTLGKTINCQILVGLQYADLWNTWPINIRLYLPDEWAGDLKRCRKAHIPKDIQFNSKSNIALKLLDIADDAGVPHKTVVFNLDYGKCQPFLEGLEKREKYYVGEVPHDFEVSLPEKQEKGKAGNIAIDLSGNAWHTVTWRHRRYGLQSKQFAFNKAYRITNKNITSTPSPGWLIHERPIPKKKNIIKCYFSNLNEDMNITPKHLVRLIYRQHDITQFYQEAESELGFHDYEGRLWHGLHRHLILMMWTYSWLTNKRIKDDIKMTKYNKLKGSLAFSHSTTAYESSTI